MKRIVAIGSRNFVFGFRAAGIKEGHVTEDGREALKLIDDYIESKEVAVVLIGESLAKTIHEELISRSSRHYLPAIVILQDGVSNERLGFEEVRRNVERATGINLMKVK